MTKPKRRRIVRQVYVVEHLRLPGDGRDCMYEPRWLFETRDEAESCARKWADDRVVRYVPARTKRKRGK